MHIGSPSQLCSWRQLGSIHKTIKEMIAHKMV